MRHAHRTIHVRCHRSPAIVPRPLRVSTLVLAALSLLVACSGPTPGPGGGGGGGEHCVASLDGAFVFAANDGVHGLEPWITDGTPEGTCLLADTAPGPDSFSPTIGFLDFVSVRLGDVAMFRAADGVYVTDGTPAGTELRHPDGRLREVVRRGDAAFVNARFPSLGGGGTYLTDGTDAGTKRLGSSFEGLDRGYLTAFGLTPPGGTNVRLFVTGDQRLRVVSSTSVDVFAEFTRECDVHSDMTAYGNDIYFVGAYDPDGTTGPETRCQLWRIRSDGAFVQHRPLASSGSQQVRNVSFAQQNAWLYYTLGLGPGSGIALRATNGVAEPLDPSDPDVNDVPVVVDGVINVHRLVQRGPGWPMYAVVTPTGGAVERLVRLTGPPTNLVATHVDDAPATSFSRLNDANAVWLGDRLVYVSSGSGLRALADGSTTPTTLIPPDGFRPFYAILPDHDHDRAFVWSLEHEGDDRFLSLWVTDGTTAGTHLLRTFCEFFSPDCG
jgi:ELWxxDGT repeat protein